MAAKIICDGCGKEAPMIFYLDGDENWHKPKDWFTRKDKDGIQDACSDECVLAIASESKKTSVIIPL